MANMWMFPFPKDLASVNWGNISPQRVTNPPMLWPATSARAAAASELTRYLLMVSEMNF